MIIIFFHSCENHRLTESGVLPETIGSQICSFHLVHLLNALILNDTERLVEIAWKILNRHFCV